MEAPQQQRDPGLSPPTILDLMVFVFGCAVSAWLLASVKDYNLYLHLMPPKDLMDWLVASSFLVYGPTIVAPLCLGLQFLYGRRERLLPGELAWLVIGLELLPFSIFWATATDQGPSVDSFWGHFWRLYSDWLPWGSPPLVITCAILAVVWHFRAGRPRHWSHRFGLAMTLAQYMPSILWIVFSFV